MQRAAGGGEGQRDIEYGRSADDNAAGITTALRGGSARTAPFGGGGYCVLVKGQFATGHGTLILPHPGQRGKRKFCNSPGHRTSGRGVGPAVAGLASASRAGG